ncbi:MAG: hypothetical protein OQJ89_08825 [Kangiellaceae bacterium]|nr:hypothetical protein [Kangiellaceae bacterium]MCW8997759.1 hypothetical protein [Kangiellaceae bacterium]MCW9017053.1 hypothetical protein [Kangiellaceae bacterium]
MVESKNVGEFVTPALYDKVHQLALEMISSSETNDLQAMWHAYNSLEQLCKDNEYSSTDHPFQWEVLADFTNDPKTAIQLYHNALKLALKADFREYVASILISLAENYLELGERVLAWKEALAADQVARFTKNLRLRKEVSEFLLRMSASSNN